MRSRSPVSSALAAAALAVLVLHACGEPEPVPPEVVDDAGVPVEVADAGQEPEDAGTVDAGAPDAGPTDAGYTTLAIEDWCQASAIGFCHRAERCLQVTAAEWDACLQRQLATCDQPAYTRGVNEGRLGYDTAAAAACINGYGSVSCTAQPEACDSVFVGQVEPQSSCLLEEECQSGSFCLTYASTCPLTCFAYRAVGESCNYWDQQCDPVEASCTQVNGQNRCVARKAAGEACVNWSDCAVNHGCINGSCVKQTAKLGEACREVQSYPNCEADAFCRQEPPPPGQEAGPGVCMRKAALGGACSGYGSCLTGLRCSSNYATGTCIPLGGVGDKCTNYNDCRLELYCAAATGRCQQVPMDGGDCGSNGSFYRCATGYFCDWNSGDTCQPLGQPGDACTYSGACTSNACSGGVCVETCSVRWDGGQ